MVSESFTRGIYTKSRMCDGSEAELVTGLGMSEETRDVRAILDGADRHLARKTSANARRPFPNNGVSLAEALDCFTSWGDSGEKWLTGHDGL